MSFFVTLVYVSLVILSPAMLMPEIAKYRIQWWVGGLAVLATGALVPYYGYPLRRIQTPLMIGFFGSVLFSRLMLGWFGGTMFAVAELGAIVVIFFLIIGNTFTLPRLRTLGILLVTLAYYAGMRGIGGYFFGWERDTYVLEQRYWQGDLFSQVDRIRFVGSLSDPNDLAQFLLVILPIVLLAWRKGAHVRNVFVALPLLGYLAFIAYLTHSRGMIVGLIAMAMVYLRNKFNKVVTTLGTAAMAVILLAANVSGGRAVSFSAGEDRIEAWSAGLGMWRGRPLTGIGYNLFTDHYELTAHNSFVLCFAELGLIGFFFWMALLVTSFLDLSRMIEQHRNNPASRDLVRWAQALRLSLTGFTATAWFLSRTYAFVVYVLLAMIVAVLELGDRLAVAAPAQAQTATGSRRPMVQQQQPVRWFPVTAALQFACLLFVYVMVRLRWAG